MFINKAVRYLKRVRAMQRINVGLSRGAITSFNRSLDITNPISWEFSALSQSGEDGIIDVLTSKIKYPNKYFVEIGSSDGIENNTSYLAIVKKFSGVMIEGNKQSSLECELNVSHLCSHLFVKCVSTFVYSENVSQILKEFVIYKNPDVFSLDIDGNDYHVTKSMMENDFRPKIIVVEYNSAFGPDRSQTIEYNNSLTHMADSHHGLYYGVSISGWRKFFNQLGYKFVTVNSDGVNAFFIDPQEFSCDFTDNICGLNFAENAYQTLKFKNSHEEQYDRIKDEKFIQI